MTKLIVEMDMPTRCAECDIVQKTKTGYRCPIASKMHGFSCVAGRGQLELPYYCPIHGVLPEEHGDLIDRDEVKNEIMKRMPRGCVSGSYDREGIVCTRRMMLYPISHAKVIVAAERKDDGTTAD